MILVVSTGGAGAAASSSASGAACKRMHKGIAEGHVTSLFRGTSPLVNYPSTNRG